MFKLDVDERLSHWVKSRLKIDESKQATEILLLDLWNLWKDAPFVPYNRQVDPYFQYNWPTPWDILVENKYDDFTRALMIGWTLKLTKKFNKSNIQIKILEDNIKPSLYNVVIIDNEWALNYSDLGPVSVNEIPNSLVLKNMINLESPK